ncbi:hypothetical protein D9M68_614940 [compost metagenome]
MVQIRAFRFECTLQFLKGRRVVVLLRCEGTSRRRCLQRPAADGPLNLAIRVSMPGRGCAQALEEGEPLVCAAVHFDRPQQHRHDFGNHVRPCSVRGDVDEIAHMRGISVVRLHIEWQAQAAPRRNARKKQIGAAAQHSSHQHVDPVGPCDQVPIR